MINKQTKIADKNSTKSSKSKSQEIVKNNFNFSLQYFVTTLVYYIKIELRVSQGSIRIISNNKSILDEY